MKYMESGLLNVKISKIGLGTGKFSTKVNPELSYQMLDYFVDHGGTVLDTARNYYEWVENGRGKSEECLGKWMELGKKRNQVCLVTKGGVRNKGNIWDINLSERNLLDEVKESMEALRTDYIDVYLLHRDEKERPVEEIVETMQRVKETAKCGMIGIANWEYGRLEKANQYARKQGMEPFRTVQTWWSLAEYTREMWNDDNTTCMDGDMYQYLVKNGYMGMAYTSQCKGYFQKALRDGIENVDSFLRRRIETEANLRKLRYLENYCRRENISATAVVCGYITDNPLPGVALVSTSSMEQLKDIMEWCDYCLPRDVIEDLDRIV